MDKLGNADEGSWQLPVIVPLNYFNPIWFAPLGQSKKLSLGASVWDLKKSKPATLAVEYSAKM